MGMWRYKKRLISVKALCLLFTSGVEKGLFPSEGLGRVVHPAMVCEQHSAASPSPPYDPFTEDLGRKIFPVTLRDGLNILISEQNLG